MKDSGIAWVEKIPYQWNVDRAKNLFRLEHRPIRPHDEIITAFRDGEVTLRKNRRISGFTEATDYSTYQGIRKGDLVIHQMDAFAGCAGISDSEGMGSPILSVCTSLKRDIELRYYAYMIRLMGLNGFILSLAKGIRERSSDFRFDTLRRLLLLLPPLSEQKAIANYLDEKCRKIDEQVKLLEKKVEAYKNLKRSIINETVTRGLDKNVKLKDSGVDWIGMGPEAWEVKRVKDVLKLQKAKAYIQNPIVLSLSRDAVKIRDITTNEGQLAESYEEYNPVKPGDVLLNPMDLQSGANCSLSLVSGVISPAYFNLRPLKEAFGKYYDYFFKIQYWSMAFFVHGKGVSYENRWTLNRSTLLNYLVVVPSLSEQQAIANYLNEKCTKIDKAIELVEKQIDAYKRLKRSLINEVVTGKRRIE